MKSLVKLDLEDITEDPNRLGWLKVIYQHQSVWARPCFLFGEMRFPSVKWIEKYGHWVGVYVEELEHPKKLSELQLIWSGFAFWEGRVPPEIYKSIAIPDLWNVVYPKPKRDGSSLSPMEVSQLANSYEGIDYDNSNVIYFDTQWMILVNENERGQVRILHKNGHKIEIKASGVIEVEGNEVNLGEDISDTVVRWSKLRQFLDNFKNCFENHIHPSGAGPTGKYIPSSETPFAIMPDIDETIESPTVKIP